MRGVVPFNLEELQSYNVNVDGEPEVIWQPLYHYRTYPNAGFTGPMLFFQEQIGQTGVSLEDTNLRTAGRMPTPKNEALVGIEVVFRPGNVPFTSNSAAQSNWNDVNAVHGGRMSLQLRIGDKIYLEEAPLGAMPMQWRVDGGAALSDTTTAGATQRSKIDYAAFCGPAYLLVPLRLIANQEFSVTINSPAAVALPSGVDGRIGIRLNGVQYRLAQ
jgi:hypothetical protein